MAVLGLALAFVACVFLYPTFASRRSALSDGENALALDGGLTQRRYRRSSCKEKCNMSPVPNEQLRVCLPGSQHFLLNMQHDFTCAFNFNQSSVSLLFNGSSDLPKGITLWRSNCSMVVRFDALSDCHSGFYRCTVSNGITSIPKTLHLKVLYDGISPLQVGIIGMENSSLIAGSGGGIACSFFSDLNFVIEFLKEVSNGLSVKISDHTDGFEIVDRSHSMHSYVLRIRNASEFHAGKYSCVVRSRTGCTEQTKAIRINIGTCPAGHYCKHNSSIPIPCPGGTYNPVAGRFDGCLTCPAGHYCPPSSSHPVSCGNVTYDPINEPVALPPHQSSDCQKCPLQSSCGRDDECRFVCARQNHHIATTGDRIHLTCHFSNSSLVESLSWFKEDKILQNCTFYAIQSDKKRSTLVLLKGRRADSGRYFCRGKETYMGTTFQEEFTLSYTKPRDMKNYIVAIVTSCVVLLLLIGIAARRVIRRMAIVWKLTTQKKFKPFDPEECETCEVSAVVHELARAETMMQLASCITKGDHVYDVFICYSSLDRAWVREDLLTQLGSLGVEACIDFRDFAVGETIAQNIADAIGQSRKTIAVLSPDFLESVYCKQELQSALRRKDDHQVIPILYKKCDVPALLKDRTYLDWQHCDVKPYFWSQLLDAIKWTPKS